MNGLGGFVLGAMSGTILTYIGIILFAKFMNKVEKEAAMTRAKEKWNKNKK